MCFLPACSLYNRNLTIPDLSQTTIGQYLYFYISDDCMRLDACLDVSIPGTDIKKSFSAYISLDPCNFVIQAYFELWSLKIVLFEYEWGKYPCTFVQSISGLTNLLKYSLLSLSRHPLFE